MVVIRLSRGGVKKRPFYKIVVTDSRKRRDSAFIERIGYFNPIARGQEQRLFVQHDRVEYWRKQGVQMSERVRSLIKQSLKKRSSGRFKRKRSSGRFKRKRSSGRFKRKRSKRKRTLQKKTQ